MPNDSRTPRGMPDAPKYQRRTPESSVLYRVVQQNLETFLASAQEHGRVVPRFVERELRAYLACGILAHGFLRVRCKTCGADRLVAFSCKGRGFCPSCTSRRMSDTAAHLVDRVFPEAPVRQWVLSLPAPLRYRLAYDHELCSAVLAVFLRAVFGALRRRAKNELGVVDGRSGSVTFVQRFGGSINLHTHFHALVLDGVYADPEDTGTARFFELTRPSDEEVARVTALVAKRIVRLLMRRGLLGEDAPPQEDPLAQEEPLLAACAEASVRHRIATGARAGMPVMRLGDRIEIEDVESRVGEQCASVQGFSLHAGVVIGGRDRKRIERLCRYISRPPIARERLHELPAPRASGRTDRIPASAPLAGRNDACRFRANRIDRKARGSRALASKQRAAVPRRLCTGVEVARSSDSGSFAAADSPRA